MKTARHSDALFICKVPAMPCATMFLNLLSQVGRLTSLLGLGRSLSPKDQTVMPFSWVLAQNALRHHGHGRVMDVIPDRFTGVKTDLC